MGKHNKPIDTKKYKEHNRKCSKHHKHKHSNKIKTLPGSQFAIRDDSMPSFLFQSIPSGPDCNQPILQPESLGQAMASGSDLSNQSTSPEIGADSPKSQSFSPGHWEDPKSSFGDSTDDNSSMDDSDLQYVPTSEEIWDSYERWKQGAEPDWPLCCQQNVGPSPAEPQPMKKTKLKQMEKTRRCCKDELNRAVMSIVDMPTDFELKNKEKDSEATGDSMQNPEMESMEISLDEERGVAEFLKLEGLHTPLSEIKDYEMLLGIASKPDSQKELKDLLRKRLLDQLKQPQAPLSAVKDNLTLNNQTSKTTQELASETLEPSEVPPVEVYNNEALQKAIDSLSVREQKPEQQLQTDMEKMQLEHLPKTAPPVNPQEDAVQQYLQQLGQDLSRVVQSRIDSMPVTNHSDLPEFPQNASGSSAIEPIDFEAHISQVNAAAVQLRTATKSEGKWAQAKELQQSTGQWENVYKKRLAMRNAIDKNMTEFRDPQSRRMRSRLSSQSCRNANLEKLKRSLLMPPLPSLIVQGLQQLRILRPTKRQARRTRLQIEVEHSQTYTTMNVNALNIKLLASKLDNTVHSTDIQVLQKRYDAGDIAWIWGNGVILITNAHSKAFLAETQKHLLSKILDGTQSAASVLESAIYSSMINVTKFPWQICLDEFTQTYTLSSAMGQGGNKYAQYVTTVLPGAAAKVFETGVIHVFAMMPELANAMIEKLYLLTANHRKTKTTTQPIITIQPVPK